MSPLRTIMEDGYKKGEMILVIDGSSKTDLARLIAYAEEMRVEMMESTRGAVVAFSKLGASLEEAELAFKKIGEAGIGRIEIPEIEMPKFPILDYTDVIVMDSFAGVCYDESAEISRKALKKIAKRMDRIVSENKSQNEVWCNKWNKKIKKKHIK